jgi:hypothetical protein
VTVKAGAVSAVSAIFLVSQNRLITLSVSGKFLDEF